MDNEQIYLEETAEIAREIQAECHATIEAIQKASSKRIDYADAALVFIYRKFAEIEIRLRKLEQHG